MLFCDVPSYIVANFGISDKLFSTKIPTYPVPSVPIQTVNLLILLLIIKVISFQVYFISFKRLIPFFYY